MSNGIGKNPLNDISKVYLQQIAAEGTMDIKGLRSLKKKEMLLPRGLKIKPPRSRKK